MNVEENRLRTFQTWPTNAPVDAAQLAFEGFFATGNFLEAQCNWCQRCTNDWQYGDDIRTRHAQLEPTCVFLMSPAMCGNVPLSTTSNSNNSSHTDNLSQQLQEHQHSSVSTALMDVTQLDLKVEANRLLTFAHWPNPNITPQSLAKAGFYYLNRADQVRCAWCKGVIAKWEKQDNAFVEHQRFFPDCPRVQLGPLIEIASDGIRDLGIQQITAPKRPKFSSLDARLRTYTNWPISDIQRPEALAQAGLYYHDIEDQVRCFHCYIGLRSWQKEDDPWFEHAKWYPDCQFVRLVKGPNYVQHVQQVMQQQQSTSRIHVAMSLDEAMSTEPVLQALEIGIDVGSVRSVTQRRLQYSGMPYDTVENLLKAIFGDPDEEQQVADFTLGHHDAAGAAQLREAAAAATVITNNTNTTSDDSHVVAMQPNCISPINVVTATSSQGNDVPPTSLTLNTTANTMDSRCSTAEATTATSIKTADTSNAACTAEATSTRRQSLEEENRKLKDARLCKVCLDEEVGVVFLPCGHLVTCVQCAPGVNLCPMCRTAIKGFVRTFLS